MAIKKNRIAGHFKIKEKIKGSNKNMSKISFFYQGIIKYN